MDHLLLHMTEAQRTYAVELIDAVLCVLVTAPRSRLIHGPGWSRLDVFELPGRRAAASLTLSNGTMFLRTPLTPRRNRFAAELVGPAGGAMGPEPDGGVAVMITTLAEWRARLSAPVTDATSGAVEKMAVAAVALLRGVVHAHRPDWELACLQSSTECGHVLRVWSRRPDGSQVRHVFTSGSSVREEGGMTPELVGEIGRIIGERGHAHVVESTQWRRYRLRLEATPRYLVSPTPDAMTTLRALGALPPQARLVPATALEPRRRRRTDRPE